MRPGIVELWVNGKLKTMKYYHSPQELFEFKKMHSKVCEAGRSKYEFKTRPKLSNQ